MNHCEATMLVCSMFKAFLKEKTDYEKVVQDCIDYP